MVEEYAREYLSNIGRDYSFEDIAHIAEGQWSRISRALQDRPDILFIDTAFVVLEIWSRVRFDTIDPAIKKFREVFNADHYFLCAPDIPWEKDPLRESEHEREFLFDEYLNLLHRRKYPFTVVSGTLQERFQMAKTLVRQMQNP